MKRHMSPILDLFSYEFGMPDVLGLSIGMEYDGCIDEIIQNAEDYRPSDMFLYNVNLTLENYQVRIEYETDEDERFVEKIHLTFHFTDEDDLEAIIQYLDRESYYDSKTISSSINNSTDNIDSLEHSKYEYYNNEFSTKVEYDADKQIIEIVIGAETTTSWLLRKIYNERNTKKIFHNNKLITIDDYIIDLEPNKKVFLFLGAIKQCVIEDLPLVTSVIESKIK